MANSTGEPVADRRTSVQGDRASVRTALGDRRGTLRRSADPLPDVERVAVDPGDGVEHAPPGEGGLGRADGDPPRRHVDRGHEPPAPVRAVPHAPALADGHQLDGVDRTEVLTGLVVDQPAGVERQAVAEESLPTLVRADEADVLAVGLGRGAQAEAPRPSSRTSALVISPTGKRVRASWSWPSMAST